MLDDNDELKRFGQFSTTGTTRISSLCVFVVVVWMRVYVLSIPVVFIAAAEMFGNVIDVRECV